MARPVPYNKGKQAARCKRDHDDWVIDNSGERRCRTCRGMRAKRDQRKEASAKLGRGFREETFSWTEIMKARGYV